MGRKSNVNPDFYKTAGRERPGQDVDQEVHRLKYTQTLAEEERQFRQAQEAKEGGSEYIPNSEPNLEESEAQDVANGAGESEESADSSNNT